MAGLEALPFPWHSRAVTAMPMALPAHGAALICMPVKLASNDNPNYVCLVYDEGYISD